MSGYPSQQRVCSLCFIVSVSPLVLLSWPFRAAARGATEGVQLVFFVGSVGPVIGHSF